MKHKIIYLILSVFLAGAVTACSDSDDDEMQKIVLTGSTTSDISVAANETACNITFNAAAPWSCHLSATPGRSGEDGLDWITLHTNFGQAGESLIHFTLEPNTSGHSRTAYIVILCEDLSIEIKVTQTTQGSDDIPGGSASGKIAIKCLAYQDYQQTGDFKFDGEYNYSVDYQGGRAKSMESIYVSQIDPDEENGDLYVETREVWTFTPESYQGKSGLMARVMDHNRYMPSDREESEYLSTHFMSLASNGLYGNGGWYNWADEEETVDWTAEYDSDGHIKRVKNNDGETSWYVYNFTWEDDLLTKIEEANSGATVTFEYDNASLNNLHSQFDLTWTLATELEVLDFAAGDISKVWASLGYLGKPSRMLPTRVTETNPLYPQARMSYSMIYETNTLDQTKVTVMQLVNNIRQSYRVWDISYTDIH